MNGSPCLGAFQVSGIVSRNSFTLTAFSGETTSDGTGDLFRKQNPQSTTGRQCQHPVHPSSRSAANRTSTDPSARFRRHERTQSTRRGADRQPLTPPFAQPYAQRRGRALHIAGFHPENCAELTDAYGQGVRRRRVDLCRSEFSEVLDESPDPIIALDDESLLGSYDLPPSTWPHLLRP